MGCRRQPSTCFYIKNPDFLSFLNIQILFNLIYFIDYLIELIIILIIIIFNLIDDECYCSYFLCSGT